MRKIIFSIVIIACFVVAVVFFLGRSSNSALQKHELEKTECQRVGEYLSQQYNISLVEISEYESVLAGPFGVFPQYRFYYEEEVVFYYPFSSTDELNKKMKKVSSDEQKNCFIGNQSIFYYSGTNDKIIEILNNIP